MEDSPVRTYPTLEKEKESQEPARVFGENMRESFASYDLDTSSWRTSALSLFGGSTLFSETWPRSGMMRNGTCCRLQPLAPHTGENGSGLWPTPRASEWKGTGPLGSKSHKHRLDRGYLDATVQERGQRTGKLNPTWIEWLMGYPLGWTDLEDSATP